MCLQRGPGQGPRKDVVGKIDQNRRHHKQCGGKTQRKGKESQDSVTKGDWKEKGE